MKLLYITNGINGSGGLERVLSIKASILADEYGYEVFILSLNDNHLTPFYSFSNKIQMLSIPVEGNSLKYTFMYRNGIRKTVANIKPDVISVCDDGLKAFFVPIILPKIIPIIYERHASIELGTSLGFKERISKKIMRLLANRFSKFIVLTTANKREWNTSNCEVIANPLGFYPKESSLLNNKRVIVVGTHSYNKGYDLLLKTWQIVVEKYPNWSLDIYGKIDTQKTFLNLSSQLNSTNSVHFHQPTPAIEKAYLEASMLLLTSRSEGFGMVLIEAMICGLPCVSFDCPSGPRDIIKNNEDGFLIAPENEIEMAEKIIFLIEHDQIRKEMGKKAKENAMRYLPEKIIKEWDILFKKLHNLTNQIK